MSKTCPSCGTENRDFAKRCLRCNTPLVGALTPVRLCPEGLHTMDPGWEECPYCKASQSSGGSIPDRGQGTIHDTPSRGQTLRDPDVPPPVVAQRIPQDWPPPGNQGARKPEVPPPPGAGVRGDHERKASRRTRYGSDDHADRRIVAVLVTYTWKREGEIYPVREGRNLLGRDPDCEIRLTSDLKMSGNHAVLTFRGKDFWIADDRSMNGTFIDDEPVEEKSRLENHARLRTGDTVWQFLVIPPLPADEEKAG